VGSNPEDQCPEPFASALLAETEDGGIPAAVSA
jgi:hypothetical protein